MIRHVFECKFVIKIGFENSGSTFTDAILQIIQVQGRSVSYLRDCRQNVKSLLRLFLAFRQVILSLWA